jgi:hypothetical protein
MVNGGWALVLLLPPHQQHSNIDQIPSVPLALWLLLHAIVASCHFNLAYWL